MVHELTVADQLSQVLVDSLGVGMNKSSLTLLPREIDNQFGERGIESSLLACNWYMVDDIATAAYGLDSVIIRCYIFTAFGFDLWEYR